MPGDFVCVAVRAAVMVVVVHYKIVLFVRIQRRVSTFESNTRDVGKVIHSYSVHADASAAFIEIQILVYRVYFVLYRFKLGVGFCFSKLVYAFVDIIGQSVKIFQLVGNDGVPYFRIGIMRAACNRIHT